MAKITQKRIAAIEEALRAAAARVSKQQNLKERFGTDASIYKDINTADNYHWVIYMNLVSYVNISTVDGKRFILTRSGSGFLNECTGELGPSEDLSEPTLCCIIECLASERDIEEYILGTPSNMVKLDKRERTILQCAFDAWQDGEMRLPGRISYSDAFSLMDKLRVDGTKARKVIANLQALADLKKKADGS